MDEIVLRNGYARVAVDIVIFTVREGRLCVLLTRRAHAPKAGGWCLPGGVLHLDESSEAAAARELTLKTGLKDVFLEQLYTFSRPDRDPRGRVVSVSYYALVASEALGDPGARESQWFPIARDPERVRLEDALELAFDHDEILRVAIERIRGKLDYVPIGFQLLPPRFTLTDIQTIHEAILGHTLDKRNFRQKLLKSGLVRKTDAQRTGAHRPAQLFEFVDRTF